MCGLLKDHKLLGVFLWQAKKLQRVKVAEKIIQNQNGCEVNPLILNILFFQTSSKGKVGKNCEAI